MNTNLTDKVYDVLNEYIVSRSSYSPRVLKKALKQTDKFPVVILSEINNMPIQQTTKTRFRETVSNIYYEVNIYARDMAVGTNTISNAEICNELKVLTDKVMNGYFQFERTLSEPTPNLDNTVYRITLRYTATLYENRERLI